MQFSSILMALFVTRTVVDAFTSPQVVQFPRSVRTSMVATPVPLGSPSTKDSIGIVGGGPAGIAAAWFLMKKGYTDITILESNNEVGGKCKTLNYTDSSGLERNYEVGAEYITYAYDTIYSFMDAVGEEWFPAGGIEVILGNGKFESALGYNPIMKVLPAAIRYFGFLLRYNNVISSPSNAGIAKNPVLSQSARDFIDSKKLDALRPIFLVRQFGYGPFDDFPAIHLLRTVPLSTMFRSLVQLIPFSSKIWRRPVASLAKSGTQGLFKKMAGKLDEMKSSSGSSTKAVLTGKTVKSILQKNGKLEVAIAAGGTHSFDKVICAVPPAVVAKIMDLPDDERNLMNMTQYHPYYVGCVDPDFNLKRAYYQNLKLEANDPVQFSKRWEDSPIVAFGYNWETLTDSSNHQDHVDQVHQRFKKFCRENMMITSYKVLPNAELWNTYHPHVPLHEFQNGYFDKLEAIQGKYGVYLTGDGMAAESMEYSCKYSKELVEKFF